MASKTLWDTVEGTASAAIDTVLMQADEALTPDEIQAAVRKLRLPTRKSASPHLDTLKKRGTWTTRAASGSGPRRVAHGVAANGILCMARDTQIVELIGRHRLIGELLQDGLEVAVPARDRGIDLIAYADLSLQVATFSARAIQMKAYTDSGFTVSKKFAKIADLVVAYVWHLGTAGAGVTYALRSAEVVTVADEMGWTATASWQEGGVYTTTSPSKKLVEKLEPFRMGPGKWWKLITGAHPT